MPGKKESWWFRSTQPDTMFRKVALCNDEAGRNQAMTNSYLVIYERGEMEPSAPMRPNCNPEPSFPPVAITTKPAA